MTIKLIAPANLLPEWRNALDKYVENYQSTRAWYEESPDSGAALNDMERAEYQLTQFVRKCGFSIVLGLLDEIDELQEHRKAVEPVGGDELDQLIWGLQREGFHARTLAALIELRERRRSDAERRSADSLHDQLSRLATHSAEESAQMAEWDRPAPKSDLRQFAEKIADDVKELIKRLPDADQGGE
ncbi:hypothetical protein ACTNF7_003416 [Citrobacter braakii]